MQKTDIFSNQMYTELTLVQNKPIRMSKTDLKYEYDHLFLSEKTGRQCNFASNGGNKNRNYRFKRGFFCLSDIPTEFQDKINWTLNYQTTVWLDDIIKVTKWG